MPQSESDLSFYRNQIGKAAYYYLLSKSKQMSAFYQLAKFAVMPFMWPVKPLYPFRAQSAFFWNRKIKNELQDYLIESIGVNPFVRIQDLSFERIGELPDVLEGFGLAEEADWVRNVIDRI